MKTLICQIQTTGERLDGMSYVILAADGSVIVVDGGMYDGDPEILIAQLEKITGADKPVVDAWFVTHNHMDHTFCFIACAEKYSDRLTVKKLVYDFYDAGLYSVVQPPCAEELVRFEAAIDVFGAQRVRPAAGDVMEYGKTKIEILYTASDLPIVNGGVGMRVNDTSLVFRVVAEGQSVLFLGDVEKAGNDVMIKKYGASLKSDVCQVAHHGASSSTLEFYRLVDPQILLWPAREEKLTEFLIYIRVSRKLVTELGVKDVHLAGFGTEALEMPIRPRVAPFIPELPQLPLKFDTGISIPEAAAAPTLDPDDPAWSAGTTFEATFFHNPSGREQKDSGGDRFSATALWKDDRLYFRIDFRKPPIRDPVRFSSKDCDNVRIYLAEKDAEDPLLRWCDLRDDPAFIENLKLYGEKKQVGGGELINSLPERCESTVRVSPEGYLICAAVSLALPHRKGDEIGLDLEFNGVRDTESKRVYSVNIMPESHRLFRHFAFPAALAVCRLI